MDNSQVEAIEEMLLDSKSEVILKRTFSIFLINRKNIVSRMVIILLGIIFSIMISSLDTVNIMREVSAVLLDTILAIFGIVFTGYAFFQALLNGQLVSVLINDVEKDEKTKKSKNTLHKTNWNFIQLMMQLLIAMFITLFVKIILQSVPDNFCLFSRMEINIIISGLCIFVYFYDIMVVLWRMISFVFNIYQLFNSYAVTKYLSFINNKDEE